VDRLPLDQWFMKLAHGYAERATCPRGGGVGAIVAQGNLLVSAGYNGAPPEVPHCDDVGCNVENSHCITTIHAESNALWFAGPKQTKGATLYVTHFPCWECCKLIVRAKIRTVVYDNDYRVNGEALKLLRFAGVDVRKLDAG
jgi:dCMP deaminase